MKKEELRARLEQIVDIVDELQEVRETLSANIIDSSDHVVYVDELKNNVRDILFELFSGERTDVEEAIRDMSEAGLRLDKSGDYVDILPRIKFLNHNGGSIEIRQPAYGGTLLASSFISDCSSPMICLCYENNSGDPFDLALAEVKRGALATCNGLNENNKGVSLYSYAERGVSGEDRLSDDFTYSWQIPYTELASVLSLDELDTLSMDCESRSCVFRGDDGKCKLPFIKQRAPHVEEGNWKKCEDYTPHLDN